MERAIYRRIAGTAAAVLLLGLTLVAIDFAGRPPAGSYTVTAVLGRAGSGVGPGTDVKVRGVRIGRVESVRLEGGQAVATLRLDPEPRLPAPDAIELVVTAKTFLGEKQVELNFPDEAFGRPPFLAEGDTIVAARPPTEVQDVLARMEPFLDAIDPEDLATIIEVLGAQRGEGPRVAENIELSAELADFGARTAADQLDRLRATADVFAALADRTADFNRLSRTLPRWTSLLPDRQADVRANLEALRSFATGLAEFLEVEEAAIDRMVDTGDVIGAVIERRIDTIGEIVYGLYRYAFKLGRHGGDLSDGTEFGYFRNFIEGEDLVATICEEAGPLAPALPGCQGEGGG